MALYNGSISMCTTSSQLRRETSRESVFSHSSMMLYKMEEQGMLTNNVPFHVSIIHILASGGPARFT